MKLLLFSYNIYLFNVLLLSYKSSIVFVHESIQKDKALFNARIFFLHLRLLYFALVLREKLAFASFSLSLFSFLSRRTTMWIIMNTGGAFNDRSIHTINTGCLFFFFFILFGSAKQSCFHLLHFSASSFSLYVFAISQVLC